MVHSLQPAFVAFPGLFSCSGAAPWLPDPWGGFWDGFGEAGELWELRGLRDAQELSRGIPWDQPGFSRWFQVQNGAGQRAQGGTFSLVFQRQIHPDFRPLAELEGTEGFPGFSNVFPSFPEMLGCNSTLAAGRDGDSLWIPGFTGCSCSKKRWISSQRVVDGGKTSWRGWRESRRLFQDLGLDEAWKNPG